MAENLKVKDKQVAEQVMHQFNLAVGLIRAGQKNSAAFRQLLSSLNSFIEILTADYKTLCFREENKSLSVNTVDFDATRVEALRVRTFLTLMKHNHFKSLEFYEGVTSGELGQEIAGALKKQLAASISFDNLGALAKGAGEKAGKTLEKAGKLFK